MTRLRIHDCCLGGQNGGVWWWEWERGGWFAALFLSLSLSLSLLSRADL